VGTGLRGYGWFKWDLLKALYLEFGFTEFTYSAAANLSGFDRKTFLSLSYDGWLVNKKCKTSRSCQWKLSTAAVNVLFGNNIPEDVESEPGSRSRTPRRCKRAVLATELFVKQIREAIEFFSTPEVPA